MLHNCFLIESPFVCFWRLHFGRGPGGIVTPFLGVQVLLQIHIYIHTYIQVVYIKVFVGIAVHIWDSVATHAHVSIIIYIFFSACHCFVRTYYKVLLPPLACSKVAIFFLGNPVLAPVNDYHIHIGATWLSSK